MDRSAVLRTPSGCPTPEAPAFLRTHFLPLHYHSGSHARPLRPAGPRTFGRPAQPARSCAAGEPVRAPLGERRALRREEGGFGSLVLLPEGSDRAGGLRN